MPLYETVFIARQDIPAQEAEVLAEKFSGIVSDNGGSVSRREYWGLRNLAYRIKKNRKGHYTMLHLDAPASAISEMERNMRLDEDVLRYLTIRMDELDQNDSIMMQGRVREEQPKPKSMSSASNLGGRGQVDESAVEGASVSEAPIPPEQPKEDSNVAAEENSE